MIHNLLRLMDNPTKSGLKNMMGQTGNWKKFWTMNFRKNFSLIFWVAEKMCYLLRGKKAVTILNCTLSYILIIT